MVNYFTGIVTESDIPVARVIRAYRADNGLLVGETVSSGDGTFVVETSYSGAHTVICLDNYSTGEVYNDLVYGNMYPTVSG